jgi:hypothetical protein
VSHFADKAGFVAALAPDDPERKAADEHVRSCCMCRDALAEGQRLVRLLADAPPLPAPTPEALKRAALAIESETQNERRVRRALAAATGVAVLLAWGLQIKLGSGLALDARSWSISLAVLAVALAGAALARANQRLVVAGLVLTSGLLAWAVGAGSLLAAQVGQLCVLFELAFAAFTWLAATAVARFSRVTLDRWHGAGVAAAGALASGAAQHLTCPVAHAGAHLLVFHVGGVALAAMLGATGSLLTAS